MALFEFEDGHLVPAQFGYPVAQDLGPDLVDAICQQVLQIVSRPLFPVTWRDMTGQDDEETPRLTALDVTGQIVSVEILKLLDSETLITSLSRLAVVASLSWSDLAAEYPSGPEGFRAGWAQFRDSMPPAVGPGPRLIMVAGEIDPSVRPALSILATSGVEVHLMNLRQMSNGRLFLDVNAVGPRLYGHAPQLLGSASAAPALPAAAPVESETPAEAEELDDSQVAAEQSEDGTDSDAQDRADDGADTPTTRPTPKVAPHLRDVFSYSVDEEPPAPWKPAGEEENAQDTEDEVVDASEENAELGDAPAGDDQRDAEQGEQDRADGERGEDAREADVPEDRDDAEHDNDAHGDDAHGDDEAEAPETEGSADDSREEDASDEENAEQGEQDRADGERGEDAREADVPEDCDDADHADDERGNPEPENAEGERVGGEPADHADAERDGDEWGDHGRPEECAVNDSDKNDNEEEQHVTQDETPRWERPAHLGSRASRRAQAEPAELNDGGATDAATASFVDRAEESPEVVAARDEGVPVLGRDEAGLRTLAQILGQDTPLVARSELGLPDDLVLAASGAISGAGLTYPSLDTMLTARGMGHIDAWTLVRIGDRLGPTLAEALDEVNREIVREYAHAPRERRAARH
ncbi:hypothetical protein HMPREF1138_1378 [Actinomyces sp. ICM58]|uniref:hypothetical protein n=1 Tax=Actinomyces sp. ICM58 TaxID=1105030 RepID=UPI0002770E94|nr:hypothetical protein [Actinomyces sp. ICM58]EJN51087.1 hypothetical protein HMPREF1138_1378 [Actinomyces sp. ICM58]